MKKKNFGMEQSAHKRSNLKESIKFEMKNPSFWAKYIYIRAKWEEENILWKYEVKTWKRKWK